MEIHRTYQEEVLILHCRAWVMLGYVTLPMNRVLSKSSFTYIISVVLPPFVEPWKH